MHAGMQIELFCERRYRGEAEIWDKASKRTEAKPRWEEQSRNFANAYYLMKIGGMAYVNA